MIRLAGAALLLASAGFAPASVVPECVAGLDEIISAIGKPGSVEATSQLEEFASAVGRLKSQSRRLNQDYDDLSRARASMERDGRYRDDRLRQIEWEQQVHNDSLRVLQGRSRALAEEKSRHDAARAAARTEAAMASVNSWAQDGNARLAVLQRDFGAWNARNSDLQARRQALLAETAAQGERLARIQQRSTSIDRQLTLVSQQCDVLTRRILAFRNIAGIRRTASIHYPTPAPATKVVKNMLLDASSEAVVRSMPRLHAMAIGNASRLAPMAKSAGWAGAAYTAADMLAQATIDGMEEREREVVRNIYLVGDYAHALKLLIAENGPAATQTDEYWLIRAELARLQSEMPTNDFDFALSGLLSPTALTSLFKSLASEYMGSKAGKGLASIRMPMSGRDRRLIYGPKGAAFFRGVLDAQGNIFAPLLIDAAESDIDSFSGELQSDAPPNYDRGSGASNQ